MSVLYSILSSFSILYIQTLTLKMKPHSLIHLQNPLLSWLSIVWLICFLFITLFDVVKCILHFSLKSFGKRWPNSLTVSVNWSPYNCLNLNSNPRDLREREWQLVDTFIEGCWFLLGKLSLHNRPHQYSFYPSRFSGPMLTSSPYFIIADWHWHLSIQESLC